MRIIMIIGMIPSSDRHGADGAIGTDGAGVLILIGLICQGGVIRGIIRGVPRGDGIPDGPGRHIISQETVWPAIESIVVAMAV